MNTAMTSAGRPTDHGIVPSSDNDEFWQAVLSRDAHFDGRIFFGVRSTGIYCRPSCPARRPRRDQVVFFRIPEAAESAGFRSCRRCRPRTASTADPRVEMVQRACRYIEDNIDAPPTLEALSAHTGVSPYHLQARVQARSRHYTPAVCRGLPVIEIQGSREERRISDRSNVRCRIRLKQSLV
jgi:methylphosphotriester-DNA--protein-cysteine methyltransferase